MWYECIDKIEFLKNLYKEIPDLKNVRIDKISLEKEGKIVNLVFDLPFFPTNPPRKWIGCNILSIEISFSCVKMFQLKLDKNLMNGDIDIKNDDKIIKVKINGNLRCSFFAESALVQRISAYEKKE